MRHAATGSPFYFFLDMMSCRARLVSLWLSQVARVIADNALRIFVLLRVAETGASERDYAWHLMAALLMLPAVLFAPFNGCLEQ